MPSYYNRCEICKTGKVSGKCEKFTCSKKECQFEIVDRKNKILNEQKLIKDLQHKIKIKKNKKWWNLFNKKTNKIYPKSPSYQETIKKEIQQEYIKSVEAIEKRFQEFKLEMEENEDL